MEWGTLPTLVLVEVYKYLPTRDRLLASSVCRNWRLPRFQVPLSPTLSLRLETPADLPRFTFLASEFIHKVPHVILTFDPLAIGPEGLDALEDALFLLEANQVLKTLKLACSESAIPEAFWNGRGWGKYFSKKVIPPLEKVLGGKNALETFSFPLLQDLTTTGNKLLVTLLERKSQLLQNLFLASLPATPVLSVLDLSNIQGFVNLQMLSITHDIVTDGILSSLGVGSVGGGLKRLNLVAGRKNSNVSNHGWSTLVANNPQCTVRLTVTAGSAISNPSSNLLFPSIPLTHFRTYYCQNMRYSFLNQLVGWNVKTLEHLEFVDEDYDWEEFLTGAEAESRDDSFMDPLIYASWTCKKLHTIKIGVRYCGHSLLGIAQLRASNLLCLEIPSSQIMYIGLQSLEKQISKALERPWKFYDPRDENFIQRKDNQEFLRKTLRALQSDEERA